jgi:putative transcriptional regulator
MELFDYQKFIKPKKGGLLISEPFLPDPNFERTVVLLCEHNEDGSVGFVLNKPSIIKFDEAVEDVEEFSPTLYVGGPVQQDTLHFIHRSSGFMEGSLQVNDEIFWGGNYEQLITMINTKVINPADFKFFLGYSGWAPGQLEEELKQKSWIVINDATAEQVFDIEPKVLWKQVLNNLGGKFKIISNFPVDPRMN